MRLALMQPYLFPYIGYFQLIHASDKFVLLDDVNYINKGWINRNRILLNNQAYTFTVPLKKATVNKKINKTYVADNFHLWKNNFLKTLYHAYHKAPYYRAAINIINDVLNYDDNSISNISEYSINQLLKYIGLNKQIQRISSILNNSHKKAQDRIIDTCKELKCQNYINLSGGKKLYNPIDFIDNDLSISFIYCNNIKYPQFDNHFIPYLSIIDIMMFNDADEIQDLILQYYIKNISSNQTNKHAIIEL